MDPHALKLLIDGSTFHNPGGNGGIAVWELRPESEEDQSPRLLLQVGFHETTNNRMELRACISALEHIHRNAPLLRIQRVQILSDSKYVCDGQRFVQYWRRNGWRSASGKPVENVDLWKEFVAIRRKIRLRVDIEKVQGKSTPLLKTVDDAAKRAAKRPWKIDRGFKGGKVGRAKLPGASTLYPGSPECATISVYRSRVMRGGEQKLYFHLHAAATAVEVSKHHAFANSPLADELHRGHSYVVRFSTNPGYPQILEILQADALPKD